MVCYVFEVYEVGEKWRISPSNFCGGECCEVALHKAKGDEFAML